MTSRKATKKFVKRISKSKVNRAVVPLVGRNKADSVSTIGYLCRGVVNAVSLRGAMDDLKERLGGKGAGLVALAKLSVPVPPAFNLSTDLCQEYLLHHRLPKIVWDKTQLAVGGLENNLKRKFGSESNPLLVSVRSGARVSMPGMMDTILNLGLNTHTVECLARTQPDNARFWWDCYRRLIHMFSSVVLGVEDRTFESILTDLRRREMVKSDSELSASALRDCCLSYLRAVSEENRTFPQDPWEQLRLAIEAVFRSWNTDRAIHYRKLNRISDDWGTAVTVQTMVFGNLNDRSGTGVVFTRNPSTGVKEIYGEYLLNAQGEDVVAGIRTPHPIKDMKGDLPKAYAQLVKILTKLEQHFLDAQDVEFTIENEKLYILQTRTAKRSAAAAIEHASQFVREKKVTTKQAIQRIGYEQVKQLLHPSLKPTAETPLVRGLPASPGACSGRIAFDPATALQYSRAQQKVILVRRETSPEDIMGMAVSEGILTSTGGMTSHAAVVGRGMGKTCVVGCSDLVVDEAHRMAEAQGKVLREGDFITLNGTTGDVYLGELPTEPVKWGKTAQNFFEWADKIATLPVLANADTPDQAALALELGAQGIGLCRTEHMFFDRERIQRFRLMILSESGKDLFQLADALKDYQRKDFVEILKAMDGFPVTVRLLDPPLHEFLPKIEDHDEVATLATELKTSITKLESRIRQLHETNPMLGHRGCRLGMTFPEIYDMQIRALAESLGERLLEGGKPMLKIMIPLIMSAAELQLLLKRLKAVFNETVALKFSSHPKVMKSIAKSLRWGTMIELPSACAIAAELAPHLDFFSFGTNDLTQTGLGISRDDGGKFVPVYVEKGIFKRDPFETLEVKSIGRLIEWAVKEGRQANKSLEIGVCGEHGGDPESIEFFRELNFDTISCSPFRVPMARLAAAKAELKLEK